MKYSRSLVATLLMSGGLLHLAPAALADGTAATTQIDNTATATYSDGTNTIDATSNRVIVTVAEVAGIDVTAGVVTNKTTPGAAINQGNQAYYNFNITNTGNSPARFHIPGNPGITGGGTVAKVEYFGLNPLSTNPSVPEWIAVDPINGIDTPAATANLIPIGGVVQVRVTVTVTGTSGAIAVSLGNTPGPNRSNQPYSTTGNTNEVNTVGGTPANGPREASAVLSENIGAVAKNNAFATVFLNRTGTTTNNTPLDASDDTISYALALKVGNNTTTDTSITAAPLIGTTIKLQTTGGGSFVDSTRILISAAIPAGTKLSAVATPPAGWTRVYSVTAFGTGVSAVNGNAAEWTTVAPTSQAGFDSVTRVGFINNTSVFTQVPISATPTTGFAFTVNKGTVVPTGTPASSLAYTVDSMAQVFGSTPGSITAGLGNLVYDESGDQTSNNSDTAAGLNTIDSTTGEANFNYGIDPGANNGITDFGEIDRYNYSFTTPAGVSLLNGPVGEPTAEGPTDSTNTTLTNNFDFTNKSSKVPANTLPGTTAFNPDSVGFTNTIQNTGGSSAVIKLLPEKLTAGAQLPVNTTIRIHTAGDAQTVTYTVTATGFTTTSATPVQFTLASGATAEYLVEVDLPLGTKLSTDDTSASDATPIGGYAVVINSFSSSATATGMNTAGTAVSAVAGEVTATNKTIDRVYTGFIKLTKEVRILVGEPDAPAVTKGTQFADPATDKTPAKGNHIEYRVTYKNISELLIGSKNVILSASGLKITENGTTGTNTWALDFNSDLKLDTSNVIGSATDSIPGSASIGLFSGSAGTVTTTDISGTTAATDVTSYVNTVTTSVTPGVSRSFSFKRKMN